MLLAFFGGIVGGILVGVALVFYLAWRGEILYIELDDKEDV